MSYDYSSKYNGDSGADPLSPFSYHPLQRVSQSKKKANSCKWAEKCADYFDYYYGYWNNNEKIRKWKLCLLYTSPSPRDS